MQFKAAIEWSHCAHKHQNIDSTLEAYTTAFKLLPRISWLGLTIASRHHALLRYAIHLARNGAAASLLAGDLEQALEWLEQGRSVVWGQLLQLRSPIDDLYEINLDLAMRLSSVALALEKEGCKENSLMSASQSDAKISPEQAIQKNHQLADKWDSLVKCAQKLPGFEHFMLPKQFSELRQATFHCPVVVLNISIYRCDALIVESPSMPPHQVHLENLTYRKAQALQITLQKILSADGIRDRTEERHGESAFEDHSCANEVFRHLLAELWSSVVRPVLDCLKSCQAENGPFRICWCPTGPLMFLPIHAAGVYNADGLALVSLADIAISSYTPTLSALLNRSPQRDKKPAFKFLAVIQPNAPGGNPLPGTIEELKGLQKHVPTSSLQILKGPDATTTTVLSGMEECSWVHLACHGIQDVSDPMQSGLLLQDGRLKLSRIIQKHITHAEFVFLSACQTATGDERRPEEAIHLAAGMLVAGFKGVIGTTWSIRDNDAPFVADKVYGQLLKNGEPSGVHPAVALHEAVQELRKRSGPNFSSWVPFIYMGA
ncbi:hypothetical protein BD410DRAFT_775091 [Rickenella mellea]|uniref:CHAT domain-containing protein n=1 Tax=Rickenella mellea TaxID=50990 RepID=A0A4Y7PUR0_9AGAM|nr:hypothetical protein BD410DRAFT_775091 [Rickenella mellea]